MDSFARGGVFFSEALFFRHLSALRLLLAGGLRCARGKYLRNSFNHRKLVMTVFVRLEMCIFSEREKNHRETSSVPYFAVQ